ncbi:hypothetical protein JGU71_20265 [Antrihabitans sp. YC3-6]|uniref:Uncharacterized protein n=1 Tax=Antrihabitans stalagmiti TaxID=2799499 RepID=A0A934NTX2_9NOCA|nr:hypothetical protein [Antrihabitans stalagmiti]MBJ8341224.1 hypothetical protein [Antrihabitans stalagmiti]
MDGFDERRRIRSYTLEGSGQKRRGRIVQVHGIAYELNIAKGQPLT